VSISNAAVTHVVALWCNSRWSDLQSSSCGFNNQSSRYQMVTAWMGDYLPTGKQPRRSTQPSTPPR